MTCKLVCQAPNQYVYGWARIGTQAYLCRDYSKTLVSPDTLNFGGPSPCSFQYVQVNSRLQTVFIYHQTCGVTFEKVETDGFKTTIVFEFAVFFFCFLSFSGCVHFTSDLWYLTVQTQEPENESEDSTPSTWAGWIGLHSLPRTLSSVVYLRHDQGARALWYFLWQWGMWCKNVIPSWLPQYLLPGATLKTRHTANVCYLHERLIEVVGHF